MDKVSCYDILDKYIARMRERMKLLLIYGKFNVTPVDRAIDRVLRRLSKYSDIVIKPADKNLGLVVMNTDSYVRMCMDHLNNSATYQAVETLVPNKPLAGLKGILFRHRCLYVANSGYRSNKKMTALASSLLQFENAPGAPVLCRVSPFYCLPKVHKGVHPPPGRPIVSAIGSLTYPASQLCHHFLLPVLGVIRTACSSSNTAIAQLLTMQPADGHIVLCADVVSLYPSIPTDLGVRAVKAFCLDRLAYLPFSLLELEMHIEILRWVLTNNFAVFKGQIYQQIDGTAMGTPCAVVYATIFLASIELPILSRSTGVLLYLRYIDDICAVMMPGTAEDFVAAFNAVYTSINLDSVTMDHTGVFLDLKISINNNGGMDLQLYQKPANKYQYIPPSSAHCSAVFYNWIVEELKRYRVRCTHDADYNLLVRAFATRLRARGYEPTLIARAVTSVPSRATLTLTLIGKYLNPNPNPNQLLSPPRRRKAALGPILTLALPRSVMSSRSWRDFASLPAGIRLYWKYIEGYGGSSPDVRVNVRAEQNIASYLMRSKFS